MRCLKGAVAVSLVCNLLLGITYSLQQRRSTLEPVDASPVASGQTQVVVKIKANVIRVNPPAKPLDWRSVESDDYRRYIANLRRIGCPGKTIRDVIVADVNELYRERYREVFPLTNRIEYWKPGNPLANLYDEGMISKQRELQAEKRDLIRTLLGADYSDEDDFSAIQLDSANDRLLSFLTPEKRTAMKELEDKFAVKKMKTYRHTWRGNDASADAVQTEKDEAMLKILTPQEKFEYDVRRSNTAILLRVALKDFELSENEFRAMFPAIREFVRQAGKPGFGAMMLGQPDPRPEATAARTTFQAKLQAVLGSERFGQLINQTGWSLSTDEQQ